MTLQRRPRKYEQPVRVQFIWERDKLELLKRIAQIRSTDVATLIQQALNAVYILPLNANNISVNSSKGSLGAMPLGDSRGAGRDREVVTE
jgi:hypothetical protein